MRNRPGRPALDPASTCPSASVHLKLPQWLFDAAFKFANVYGISMPELARNALEAGQIVAESQTLTPQEAFAIVRGRRDEERAQVLAHQRENMSAHRARRDRRLRDGFIERIRPEVVLAQHDGICGICNKPIGDGPFHVDHIIPLAKGGKHSYANTQPAHGRCNSKKRDRIGFTIKGGSDV